MLSARQCKAARAWLGWSQVEMCNKANLYRQQLIAFEREQLVDIEVSRRVENAINKGGVRLGLSGSIILEP